MRTLFIKDFIDDIHPKNIYPKAHEAFTSLPYSDETRRRAEELKKQLQNCTDAIARLSFDNELNSLYQYGERLIQSENEGEIAEPAVSYDFFLYRYYLKWFKAAEAKVNESLKGFLNDINLSGMDKLSKTGHLQNILHSTDYATCLCLDFTSESARAGLYILEVIKEISDIIISELEAIGVAAFPKYDCEKIRDFLMNPYGPASDDKESLFVGVKSNRQEENYYLFKPLIKGNTEEVIHIPDAVAADDEFEEFKKDRSELCNLSVGEERVFSEESLCSLFTSLKTFNSNPAAIIPKINIDITHLTIGRFGEAFHALFNSKYFKGNKSQFEDFIKRTFLWRGNDIESTASFRSSNYKKKKRKP